MAANPGVTFVLRADTTDYAKQIREAEKKFAVSLKKMEDSAAKLQIPLVKIQSKVAQINRNAGAPKIRSDFKKLGAEADRAGTKVKRGMDKASKAGGGLRKSVVAVRLAILAMGGAATLAYSRMVAEIDRIAKASKRVAVEVEALQGIIFAGKKSGIQESTLVTSIQRMGRRASEAAQGQKELKAAFDELGVSVTDLNGQLKTPERLLYDISDAFSALENPLDRNRLAMKIFDTEGVAMVQMLNSGSEALRKMTSEAKNNNAVFSKENAKRVEATADAWDGFGSTLFGLAANALPAADAALGKFFRNLAGVADSGRTFSETMLGASQLALVGLGDLTGAYDSEQARFESSRDAFMDRLKKGNQKQRTEDAKHRQLLFKQQESFAEKVEKLKKQETVIIDKEVKKQKQLLDQQRSQLKAMKRDLEQILKEFDNALGGINDDGEAPDYLDVAILTQKAKGALDTGDAEKALELAQKAKDAASEAFEAGNINQFNASNQIKLAKDVAEQAGENLIENKEKEVATAEQLVTELLEKFAKVKQLEINFNQELAKKNIDQILSYMQQQLNSRPLQAVIAGVNSTGSDIAGATKKSEPTSTVNVTVGSQTLKAQAPKKESTTWSKGIDREARRVNK